MQDLSLNILDIAENSVRAKATLIEVEVFEDTDDDVLFFSVRDNGCGMDEEMLKKVTDPFTTTRTTRRVGLGIPLLKAAAEAAGGGVEISSMLNAGTFIKATFSYSNIDRQPLGDVGQTMSALICMNPDIDFCYKHTYDGAVFELDTRRLREILGAVSFGVPAVAQWISEYIEEGINNIYGGAE
ncbi:MAG: ATP-binding protein [Clostridia bacterium]|nr:ATP-binding protein [Clostridia bacterium]